MCLVFLVGVSACGALCGTPPPPRRHHASTELESSATVTESAGALPLKKKNGPESAKPKKMTLKCHEKLTGMVDTFENVYVIGVN